MPCTCGATVHRDDAMNRRCDSCEQLVRNCKCEHRLLEPDVID